MTTAHQPELPTTVEALAERQDGAVSVAQALAAGLTPRQIAWRRSQGRYDSCRRRVIRVAGAPSTWRQALRIATLAAGDGVAVSHGSAARLHGLAMPRSVHRRWRRDDAFLELSAPDPRHVRLAGVRGHRSGTWEEGDLESRHGMVVTSPLRTLIDLSSRLGVDGCGRLLDEMLRHHLVTLAALRERVTRLRPAPGRSVRVLRLVVAACDDSSEPDESTRQPRTRRVVRRAPFRSPTRHHGVHDGQLSVRLELGVPAVTVYLEGSGCGFDRWARISIRIGHDDEEASRERPPVVDERRAGGNIVRLS